MKPFDLPKNDWSLFFSKSEIKSILNKINEKYEHAIEKGDVVYPKFENIFKAFSLCEIEKTKVILIGQDPYHGENEANGLCFSVNLNIKTPPSLQNIFKELGYKNDLFSNTRSTDLSDWANQGVLLLNSVLTVEKDKAASHQSWGWQILTDLVIQFLSEEKEFLIFILLGNYAQSKKSLIDITKHKIIETVHPSPLSAYRGFFGSNVFVTCNDYLIQNQKEPINW
jgi:uracil-DNA glycosylase